MWRLRTLLLCWWELATTSSRREEWQHTHLMEFIQPLKTRAYEESNSGRKGRENSRMKSGQRDQSQLWAAESDAYSRPVEQMGRWKVLAKVSPKGGRDQLEGGREGLLALSAGGGGINSGTPSFPKGCAICRVPPVPTTHPLLSLAQSPQATPSHQGVTWEGIYSLP